MICRFNNDGSAFLYHVCQVCEHHLYRPTECTDIDKKHVVQKERRRRDICARHTKHQVCRRFIPTSHVHIIYVIMSTVCLEYTLYFLFFFLFKKARLIGIERHV